MKLRLKFVLAAATMLFGVQVGHADPLSYSETGDAGDLSAGAQSAGSADEGGTISGLGGSGDVDMYSFTWSGGWAFIFTFWAFFFFKKLFFF